MPWIPKKDALRRFREASGYSIYDLAGRVGISERQIRKIESETPPGSIFNNTIASLAKTLGCAKEDLATWVARKPTAMAPDAAPPARDSGAIDLDGLAEMERERRLAGHPTMLHFTVPEGTFELLGAERAREIHTQFGAFDGQRFLVIGQMTRQGSLPDGAAAILGVESGVGRRFKIARQLFDEIALETTIITTTADLTRVMLDAHRDVGFASLLVRVVVARPTDQWKGFVGLETDAKPVPHAFIVDGVAVIDLSV